jgi:hypothetical protein
MEMLAKLEVVRAPSIGAGCLPAFILLPAITALRSAQRLLVYRALIAEGFHASIFPELRPRETRFGSASSISSTILGIPINNFMNQDRCEEVRDIIKNRSRSAAS